MKSGLKSKLLLVACMCLFSGIIYAQERPQRQQRQDGQQRVQMTVEERAKAQADRMKKDLDLTDKQYKSVKELNEKYAKKMEENTERNMETFKTLNDDKNKELKKILTDDQYKKFEEQNANRRRPEGRQGERPQRGNENDSKKDDKK